MVGPKLLNERRPGDGGAGCVRDGPQIAGALTATPSDGPLPRRQKAHGATSESCRSLGMERSGSAVALFRHLTLHTYMNGGNVMPIEVISIQILGHKTQNSMPLLLSIVL